MPAATYPIRVKMFETNTTEADILSFEFTTQPSDLFGNRRPYETDSFDEYFGGGSLLFFEDDQWLVKVMARPGLAGIIRDLGRICEQPKVFEVERAGLLGAVSFLGRIRSGSEANIIAVVMWG